MEVVGRASSRPSPQGLAAVAALRRVAAEREHTILDGTVDLLSETQPRAPWIGAPGWRPVKAWRAVSVWESERVLLVEFDGPRPHTLMAAINEVGGCLVETLAVVEAGAAASWPQRRESDGVPMPLTAQPVEDVLADLAAALRVTDMTFPRQDDKDFVALRALAWSRCRGYLPEWPDHEPLPVEERRQLTDDFVAAGGLPDDEVTRSLVLLFLDYGEGHIGAHPLGWSPGWVALFLGDWLPRKAVLDADQRSRLPETLRAWVRFALHRRGVDPRWIEPVVAAVDDFQPEFSAAFDDKVSWGPAKAIAAALAERGVDLSDRDAVENAVRAINAERHARTIEGQ